MTAVSIDRRDGRLVLTVLRDRFDPDSAVAQVVLTPDELVRLCGGGLTAVEPEAQDGNFALEGGGGAALKAFSALATSEYGYLPVPEAFRR